MKSIIEMIQDDDPSYDPLTPALEKAGITKSIWEAATDRIYFDGYYGPISPEEWEEQDGRVPSKVSDAIKLIARVLEGVEDYTLEDFEGTYAEVSANEIKAALVPFYREIYGVGYPT